MVRPQASFASSLEPQRNPLVERRRGTAKD
jgi:hypothetical protein